MLSLVEGLEHGIFLQKVMQEVIGRTIPVSAIVDNKSSVDAIHSTKLVEDKRLRIDIAIVKEMMANEEVQGVTWVPGEKMISDVLTKQGVNPYPILKLVQKGLYDIE